MAKGKDLIIGCGLAIVTCMMWLVSSCVHPSSNSVPVTPTLISFPPVTTSSTTTETRPVGNSTTVITTTTAAQQPTPDTTTPTANPTATTTPPIISTPTPSEGQTVPADINGYLLYINGLVNNPQTLSYAQILALPATTQTVEIACPDVIDETDQWTGVSMSALLNAAGLMPEAGEVVLTGADGYFIILPLQTVLEKGVFLAYQMNGQDLSQDRGYPLRLVVTGMDGGDWLRWVTNIEVKQTLVSFSNSSFDIRNLSRNIPLNGSKLCSCFLPRTALYYPVVEENDSKNDQTRVL